MSQSLSIIIATKDRFDHLRKCVESILGQTVLPDDVVIVDGSSEEDLKERIDELFANAHTRLLKYIKSRPSLTAQNNLGIKNSSSDLITILDDDVVLEENYICEVKEFFNTIQDKRVGALSTKILDSHNPGERNRFSVSEFLGRMFLLWHFGDGRFQNSGIPTLVSPDCKELTKVEFILGGNATFPRRILEEFAFDENLPMGFMMSDDDLAYRISRKYQNYWTPKTCVYHRSHYVGSDRYSKSKQLVLTILYLRRKNLPPSLKYSIAAWRAIAGKTVTEFLHSVKNRNLSGLKGVVSGLFEVVVGEPAGNTPAPF